MNSDTLMTICLTIFASSGFWGLITWFVQTKTQFKSAEKEMLKGLGHDRICYLGAEYIKRGSLSKDEYENLVDYLYKPYKALGGNGTAEKIIDDVKKLPIKEV